MTASRRRDGPRRRRPDEKRRRIYREVWYLRDGAHVAHVAAHDTSICQAVTLKPGARVINVSNDALRKQASLSPEIERLINVAEQQATAVADLSQLVTRLLGSQPDAVRTEDRLIVLNRDALESEGPPRRRWMQASRVDLIPPRDLSVSLIPPRRTAARMRFVDETYRQGEVEVAEARPGDQVKFVAAIQKPGWPRVDAGAVGRVLEVHPGTHSLSVDVRGSTHTAEGVEVGPQQIEVDVHAILLLLHSEDPRAA